MTSAVQAVERVKSWARGLTDVVNEATAAAPEQKVLTAYWEAAGSYVTIQPRRVETSPLPYKLQQSLDLGRDENKVPFPTPRTAFKDSISLWAVTLQVAGVSPIEIALHADLNVESIILSLSTRRDFAGVWMRGDHDPEQVCESLPVLLGSTEWRVRELVVAAIKRTIDVLVRAAEVEAGEL